jgi:hypothetical protein
MELYELKHCPEFRNYFGDNMKNIFLILTFAVFALSACIPATSEPNMDEPVMNESITNTETVTPQVDKPVSTITPVDSNLLIGNVYLDSTELLTLESTPLQFMLALKGSLPTPCNQLRVDVSRPDSENKIIVDVYSVTKPDEICAQVLQPFEENFPLGSFPAGHYTLWVNGELVTEFDA